MKTNFYAQRPLNILNREIAEGDLVATVETPDGIPLDRAVNAIANSHATPEKREKPKADKAASAPAAEQK